MRTLRLRSGQALIIAALMGTALVAAPALQATQESHPSSSLERPFVANGRINMDLSAGDYRISGTPDKRIRLEWSVRDSDQLAKVKMRADVSGSAATISTDAPTNSNLRVTIQVPARTDLYVRLTAGDMTIERIEGNKDIEAHAGDLNIDVIRAEDYHTVDASIWAGDITARPFNITKEGLFRSFDWKGHGPYRLHAHLKAGDLRLFSKLAEQQ